eukprot:CCRYP_002963-RA/>CCRYP_002963-RA protein AED:0.30 eAED:0.30 QI:129/1/1/1/1/1/2/50/216
MQDENSVAHTEYIHDVSLSRSNDKVGNGEPSGGNWFNSLARFTTSFEEEGILGLSFGIVRAVTSTALNVVSGATSNVERLLTHTPNLDDSIAEKKYETNTPGVLQFAYTVADILLGAVSPVLDLHFFGFHPSPEYHVERQQLLVYWEDPSVKKSIGYDHEQCSFYGTESVYFDTSSAGFYSAIAGDGRSSSSVRSSDDFYSAVSREEVEEMEIEFV